jgi:class 3 adenylate cyclase
MERKLAAILAADVAGYSRLMGVDEEGTLTALRSLRDIADRVITAHRGRVFGSAGDNILAEFPSAVEAIYAAVEIQQEISRGNEVLSASKQLRFRISVNIGGVMVEGDNLFYPSKTLVMTRRRISCRRPQVRRHQHFAAPPGVA